MRLIEVIFSVCFLLAAGLIAQPTAPEFMIETVAGTQNLGDRGPAVEALLAQPNAITSDRSGNIFFYDRLYNRIRRISPSGQIDTVVGNGVFGSAGAGGPANAVQLGGVFGLAVAPSGNLFYTDANSSTVRTVGSDGVVRVVAGSTLGFGGDGGTALQARFAFPSGIAFDAAGNLYLADRINNRVRRIASNGAVSTVAGTGTAGSGGDGGPATSAQLSGPSHVAVDSAGNILVLDAGNGRVRIIDPTGVIRTLAGGPATQPPFGFLSGIAVDATRNVYVGDLARSEIRRIAPDGTTSVVAGGRFGSGGDQGPATSASLDTPSDVTLDPAGNVVFTDTQNNRIRRVASGIISTIAGRDRRIGTRAGGAELFAPAGVDLDAMGNLYVVGTGNQQVFRVDSAGSIRTVAGTGRRTGASNAAADQVGFNGPQDISMDADVLYILDSGNGFVRRLDSSDRVNTVAGAGALGFADGPAAMARFAFPGGILAAAGDVLIGDTFNNRLRRLRQGVVSTIAGTAQAGFSGDDGPAAAAQLRAPRRLARDSAGNTYVADSGNHRIRVISSAGVISTLAGTGTAGLSGDGGQPELAQLNFPTGVAVDRNNNVYIADTGNDTVRMIVRASAATPARAAAGDVIFTIAGNSIAGFSGDGGRATAASLNAPLDVAVDAQGNVYVSDSVNDRVRKLTPVRNRFSAAGLVNAASFRASPATPGGLFTLFGTELASRNEVNMSAPLPNQLAGTAVELTDSRGVTHACGMVSVTPGQISFVVPGEAAPGQATLTVRRDGASIGSAPIQVEAVSPGLFSANANGRGVAAAVAIRVAADGTQSQVPVFAPGGAGVEAVPIDLGPEGEQIILLLFGTGIRGQRTVTVTAGTENLSVLGAAAQGQFPGLDQINVILSRALAGRGEVNIVAFVDGKQTNTVTVNVR